MHSDWGELKKVGPQFFWFGGVTGAWHKILYTLADMVKLFEKMGANLLYQKYIPMIQQEGQICIHNYFEFMTGANIQGIPGASHVDTANAFLRPL